MRAAGDQRGTEERKKPGERGGLRFEVLGLSVEFLVLRF